MYKYEKWGLKHLLLVSDELFHVAADPSSLHLWTFCSLKWVKYS